MVKFSVVCPTHDRPQFIEKFLFFLCKQQLKDFEVVISDNYSDPVYSCEMHCENAVSFGLDIKYVTPDFCMNMVDNWNYAYSHASGDYILFLSDKMLLMPNALYYLSLAIEQYSPDIVSWYRGRYYPYNLDVCFGDGDFVYIANAPKPKLFDCTRELESKYAGVSFSGRGQIYSGAYSRGLCEKIIASSGALFHPINCDYTSMILALAKASNAVELPFFGVCDIHTKVSNGDNIAKSDLVANTFLDTFVPHYGSNLLQDALLPNVSSALFNILSRDFRAMKQKYNLFFDLNEKVWLSLIYNNMVDSKKKWSSLYVKKKHFDILFNVLKQKNCLRFVQNRSFILMIKRFIRVRFVWFARRFFPSFLWKERIVRCKSINDILDLYTGGNVNIMESLQKSRADISGT